MFIPHTQEDRQEMLDKIGVSSVKELLSQIPQDLLYPALDLPRALSEQELTAHMQALAARNKPLKNFIGAGIYEHFIPAAVNALSSRGEFLTAYTPYQAEASQGTLQTIYEFQSCMCALTDMDVATASHYDGATALAEAALACLRLTNRTEILISAALHPHYKEVLQTYVRHQPGVCVKEAPLGADGTLDLEALSQRLSDKTACFVLATPNFFGCLEQAEEVSSRVHQAGALLTAVVNPIANAMNFGGPGLGIMTAKKAYMRQLPGRIVGIAKDKNGRRAFVLTLQAREQHIRRERASSNICSNEALCALNAVIYLTLLGPAGLAEVAELNLERAHQLAERVGKLPGFRVKYAAPFFNEFVLECPVPAKKIIQKLEKKGLSAGYALGKDFKGMENCLLVCATETKTAEDLQAYAEALGGIK